MSRDAEPRAERGTAAMPGRFRLASLVAVSALVGMLAFTAAVLLWSRDPQAAVAILVGPLFGLILMIPAYLAGKGLEFVIRAARRDGLHVEERSVTVGTPGIVSVLVLAVFVGAWLGWSAR